MEELVKAHLRFTSLMEKRARKAFLDSVKRTITNTDFSVGINEIRSGTTPYVEHSIVQRFVNLALPLGPLEVVIRDTFIGGGRITAKAYGNSISKASNEPTLSFDFNPALPDAIDAARYNAAEMVKYINQNTKDAIRRRVMQALADGEAPWELAESLTGVVGLTPRDVQAVESYRAAMTAQKSRTEANRLAKRYAKQLLAQRATVIARTEVLKASNAGQQQYWKQGVAEGYIDPDEMQRMWIAAVPSERTCGTCGRLHGTYAPIDGAWTLDGQTYDIAHAHPQCRCTSGLVFATSPIKKTETIAKEAPMAKVSRRALGLIEKYGIAKANPYHDKLGRFASKPGNAAAEGAVANDSPRATLNAAGLKTRGGDDDIEEYPTAAKAKAAVRGWADYQAVSVMGGDGTVRHFASRFTPASQKVIASTGGTATASKPAAKKPAEKKPNTTIPHDESKPVRQGFQRVKDTDAREALMQSHGVRVPPAWTDVQVSVNPKGVQQSRGGMLLATGKDAKGRTQYLYSAEHNAGAAAKKFGKLKESQRRVGNLDRHLKAEATTDPVAGATLLIRRLGMRPGSDRDTGAEKKAYGATNLQARHARINAGGKSVTFDFDSKKGGRSRITTRDPLVVETVKAHKAGKRPTDKLFPGVNEAKTNDYVKRGMGSGFTQKDLRTLVASTEAAKLVASMPVPTSKAASKKARNEVGDHVSNILQNTRTVALGSYITPEVFAEWP